MGGLSDAETRRLETWTGSRKNRLLRMMSKQLHNNENHDTLMEDILELLASHEVRIEREALLGVQKSLRKRMSVLHHQPSDQDYSPTSSLHGGTELAIQS